MPGSAESHGNAVRSRARPGPRRRPLRRGLLLLACVAGAALAAPAAKAADPIMPLSEVRPGMSCTSLTVIRGVEPAEFSAEVLDVVSAGDVEEAGPRILLRASGEAIEETGVAQGFSGSPVYCRDSEGTRRVIGAIGFGVGDSANRLVLATPIEEMLGEQPNPPAGASSRTVSGARPLAVPLVVSGLSPRLGRVLERAALRAGRQVVAAPRAPLQRPAPRPLRPGSSVAAGLSEGDIALSAIGTVSYVDGRSLWAFAHALDGVGPRSLLLQDAYVYTVVPRQQSEADPGSFKLATPLRTVGAFTNDTVSGVVGRTGPESPTFAFAARATDLDRGRQRRVDARGVDESLSGYPAGSSALGSLAGLGLAQSTTSALGAVPSRLSTVMCLRVEIEAAPRPLGFCNRYVPRVGTGIGAVPGSSLELPQLDIFLAAQILESYRRPLGLERLTVDTRLRRGLALGRILRLRAPRRARRGQALPVRALIRAADGRLGTVAFRVRVPRRARPGPRTLTVRGTPADPLEGVGDLGLSLLFGFEAEDVDLDAGPAPQTPRQLADALRSMEVYDGLRASFTRRGRGAAVYRDRRIRITGQARTRVLIR